MLNLSHQGVLVQLRARTSCRVEQRMDVATTVHVGGQRGTGRKAMQTTRFAAGPAFTFEPVHASNATIHPRCTCRSDYAWPCNCGQARPTHGTRCLCLFVD